MIQSKTVCYTVKPCELRGLACPIFFQFVVDGIFNSLIKHHFKCDEPEEEEVDDHIQLNYEEQNALRYTAGYVVNALIKKLKHSTHPLKEEMMCCLLEVDDRTEGDTPHIYGTEDWTRKVDREGLKRIGDMMYGAFEAIEVETRRFFRRDPSRLQNFKTQLQEKILSSDDVKFFWAIVSAGWEEDESEALLELMVEQFCDCLWILLPLPLSWLYSAIKWSHEMALPLN